MNMNILSRLLLHTQYTNLCSVYLYLSMDATVSVSNPNGSTGRSSTMKPSLHSPKKREQDVRRTENEVEEVWGKIDGVTIWQNEPPPSFPLPFLSPWKRSSRGWEKERKAVEDELKMNWQTGAAQHLSKWFLLEWRSDSNLHEKN